MPTFCFPTGFETNNLVLVLYKISTEFIVCIVLSETLQEDMYTFHVLSEFNSYGLYF